MTSKTSCVLRSQVLPPDCPKFCHLHCRSLTCTVGIHRAHSFSAASAQFGTKSSLSLLGLPSRPSPRFLRVAVAAPCLACHDITTQPRPRLMWQSSPLEGSQLRNGRHGLPRRQQAEQKPAHSWTKKTVWLVQQSAKDADGSWSSELDGFTPAPLIMARTVTRQAARMVRHGHPGAPCAPSHSHRRSQYRRGVVQSFHVGHRWFPFSPLAASIGRSTRGLCKLLHAAEAFGDMPSRGKTAGETIGFHGLTRWDGGRHGLTPGRQGRAEHSGVNNGCSITVLQDLQKCYEFVAHAICGSRQPLRTAQHPPTFSSIVQVASQDAGRRRGRGPGFPRPGHRGQFVRLPLLSISVFHHLSAFPRVRLAVFVDDLGFVLWRRRKVGVGIDGWSRSLNLTWC